MRSEPFSERDEMERFHTMATLRANVVLLAMVIYCGGSWAAMRSAYFGADEDVASMLMLAHLAVTVAILLAVASRKRNSIRAFGSRLSALDTRGLIALLATAAILIFTMLDYPRNRMSLSMFALGLTGSTTALVNYLFLSGAAAGTVLIIFLNAPGLAARFAFFCERLLFQSPERLFLFVMMLLMFLATNAISLFQFHHFPVCSDEVSYLFQAKIFAAGRLYANPPKYPEFFDFVSFVIRDKWYSIVAPGFPMILAVGILVGAPWLVNPALATLCVPLMRFCAGKMYDDRIARGSVALLVVSPFFLTLSSVYLSHTSTAFFLLLFLYFFLKGIDGERRVQFLLAGLALGGMALTRPLTAAAASIPWAAYTLWLLARRRMSLASAAALVAGLAVGIALLLAYNRATTGDPFLFGYTALYGDSFRLGFVRPPQELVFARSEHTPLRGILNVNTGFHSLNHHLFGWPIPSLLFALLPFAALSRNKWDYLLLANLLSIPAVYFFFFHQDFLMGPRYYFCLILPAVILTARGFREAPALWRKLGGKGEAANGTRAFLATLLLVCVTFNFAYFLPGHFRTYSVSSDVFQGMTAPVWKHVRRENITNAVVFIKEFPFSLTYGAGLWRNNPDLNGEVVYARDQGESNILLMNQYPDRKYYRYDAPSDSFHEIAP